MSVPFTADVMLENLTPHAAGAKSEDLNQSGHLKTELQNYFCFCASYSALEIVHFGGVKKRKKALYERLCMSTSAFTSVFYQSVSLTLYCPHPM